MSSNINMYLERKNIFKWLSPVYQMTPINKYKKISVPGVLDNTSENLKKINKNKIEKKTIKKKEN